MHSPVCFATIRVRSSSALIVGSKKSAFVILLLNSAALPSGKALRSVLKDSGVKIGSGGLGVSIIPSE